MLVPATGQTCVASSFPKHKYSSGYSWIPHANDTCKRNRCRHSREDGHGRRSPGSSRRGSPTISRVHDCPGCRVDKATAPGDRCEEFAAARRPHCPGRSIYFDQILVVLMRRLIATLAAGAGVYHSTIARAVHFLSRAKLLRAARRGLRRGEFHVVYQPIFDLNQMRMIGVEALLRWHHPTRGLLQPDQFIPILETSALIVPVGRCWQPGRDRSSRAFPAGFWWNEWRCRRGEDSGPWF